MSRVIDTIKRFLHARRGVAAVEFAIVLPVALLLYVGAAEVADGVMTSRKVSNVTRTLVDLLSAQSTSSQADSTPPPANALSATQLANIMAGAQMLLSPQPLGSLKMTLTAVDVVAKNKAGKCCQATVRWSYTQNGTQRPCSPNMTGTTSTNPGLSKLPSEMLPTGTVLTAPISYLIADVEYTYQPVLSTKLFNFAPVMKRTQYMMPRTTGQVVTGPLPSSGTQVGTVCY